MRYWKGIAGTTKDGQFGTMDDNGIVPDSVIVTKAEYEAWVALQPKPEIKDYKDLYTKASTMDAKLAILAEKVGLI